MMHFGEKFTDDEVEEMIAEADANNDGKIDYTEFSQMILKEIDSSSSGAANVNDNEEGAPTSATIKTPQKKLIS